MARHRPRKGSPRRRLNGGVSLKGDRRSWTGELNADGGKKLLHSQVRLAEKAELGRVAAEAIADRAAARP